MLRLNDEQRERIREHFPEENLPEGRAGRKPMPAREVLEAVLWILNTAAQWHMLPQCYPSLRRYERRWIVERFFAWLHWKRRLLIRWEYYAANFLGFVQLASITMLLKRF